MFNLKGFAPTKAYNGKVGCMCGCRGTYVESGPAMTRRVNKVQNFVGPVRPDAANLGDKVSYSTEAFGGVFYAYVEEDGRNTTVYFKKS